MSFRGQDFISIRDYGKKEIALLLDRAGEMDRALAKGKVPDKLKNRIVATLFFEPSTRTRMSFQTAAQRLGAHILNLDAPEGTSLAKGETFSDTIRIVDGYSDLIVLRHAKEGSARLAAEIAEHPVINGGDGGNQHPTQTLLDLYAIKKLKGKIGGLDVCLLGDLKYGRVMRSLLYGLAMFGANPTLMSPKGLEMEKGVVDEVKSLFNIEIRETNKIDFRGFDVLYMCRIQKERFADPYEAEKVQKEFMIREESLAGVKDDLVILHPLPKINEIDPHIDKSKHAFYFEQAKLGVPVRMALMAELIR